MACASSSNSSFVSTHHSEQEPRPLACTHLLSLPADIIHLICLHVCSLERLVDASSRISVASQLAAHYSLSRAELCLGCHVLLPLSSTCRDLRTFCLPMIFRATTLTQYRRVGPSSLTPPPAIHHFVRDLCLHHVPLRQNRASYEALLRGMPNLRHIYIARAHHAVSVMDVFSIAFSAPALESLTIEGVQFDPQDFFSITPPSLQALRIGHKHYLSVLPRLSPAFRNTGGTALECIIDSIRTCVDTLVLPGECLRTSFFAVAPWPRLRSLSISGVCPILDAPIVTMLSAMPSLQELIFAVAQHEGAPPLILVPQTTAQSQVPNFSRLQRFAIAFPNEGDAVFMHLPSTLSSLSLSDTPRYYDRQDEPPSNFSPTKLIRYSAPILTSRGSLRIFETINGTLLHSLELVVLEDTWEYSALTQISRSCVNLRNFEYHRYRDVNHSTDYRIDIPDIPVELIARALSSFTRLRLLKMNLDYPYKYRTSWGDVLNNDTEPVYMIGHVQTIARAVPWLEALALLVQHPLGFRCWKMWSVRVVDENTVLLEDVPNEHDNHDYMVLT